jgi:hypothetical protein
MYIDYIVLLIVEKALTFISGYLDVFRTLSRYDNRRPCIVPCKSKMQFEHTTVWKYRSFGDWRGEGIY